MTATAAISTTSQKTAQGCSVAIIGTEGTGKTVLITTLASRFSRVTPDGLFLSPSDNRGVTYKYVSRSWDALSKGQWPPITKRGEFFQLEWILQEHGTPVADIRMIDVSGEDLRLLFDDGQIDEPTKLSDGLRRVVEYLRDAKIILVLVDLDDIVSNRDGEHVRQTQWVINYALKSASTNGIGGATALVFTKADRYEALIQREGGLESVIQKYLPLVYGNYVEDGRLSVLSVAAVAETRVDTSSREPRQVPVMNFKSRGLDTLMKWIHGKARAVAAADAARRDAIRTQQAAEARVAKDRDLKKLRDHRRGQMMKSLLLALLLGVLAQPITLPALRYLYTHRDPSVETRVPRQVDHPGNWYLLWLNSTTETVYDVTVSNPDYKVNTSAVVIWDMLLTTGGILIAWKILYEKFNAASPAPQN
ncbi:MAG: ATP-binding protein [Phycisphaeraceae bacterium]|nr:ATP-binding protein [Phycisphaeraceae bacterium]